MLGVRRLTAHPENVMTSDLLNRIVFIKAWAYFVLALIIGSSALFFGRSVDLILSVISGLFSFAGLVYYCIAVSRFIGGRREHGVHLIIGTVLLIAYCSVIIIGKLYVASHPSAA